MEISEIKQILENALELDEVIVNGEGSHYQVIAVGAMFDGMSRVKKQQAVYAPLMSHIASNAIHALSIKAYTPEEWARDKKLMSL
ncbi:BolA family iron metabolism protein IbaG [Photobacterium sp. WH77]|uniref:BolA/IbaG family iron-sulfur metabolism protein n=2 Tax=Photobacterium TaxID=657 RepID=A0A0F5VEL6_9GAMM|nr:MULTISPECIES: BolA family iron metabolism protein IbaG [Photobacterium]MBV7262034.1 BolA family iron metabolism protein IbaG [Photobacterium sp. WH24]MCG2836574.1 BolA family iron metabolism protein IbaG [Photobacterium sp. WH77]MCG2844299.1 BolA family iron metabolism protein IbaG [Photobacterium sp. WH80]KKC99939.1 cell division protein BolA [Photobacterium halotolerans]MBD8513100.1 BolA family iron metabolism protein IbaG [Photobacterium arenosum]